MAGGFFNKMFMALLTATLVAMLAGWLSGKLVHPQVKLAENAYKVALPEKVEAAPAGAAEETLPPIAPLLAAANPEAGQKLSRACGACHGFEKGGAAKVGPNLWNIVNAKHAHQEGFAYSDAMKALADKPWDYEALNAFLANPKAAIKGTKMNYAGLKKPEERANLIAWLRTLSDSPAPLP